jgi:transcriptional regulator with XRE-family HTH domain
MKSGRFRNDIENVKEYVLQRSVQSIDARIGEKIRYRRWALDMSQKALSDRLGVSFQQIQKYEMGTNRISAARLWQAAIVLDVPIEFFFRDLLPSSVNVEPNMPRTLKQKTQNGIW